MKISINLENGEKNAQELLRCASLLGTISDDLGMMEREGWDGILQESEASELIQLSSGEICRALRVLAMRLDRAALAKGV